MTAQGKTGAGPVALLDLETVLSAVEGKLAPGCAGRGFFFTSVVADSRNAAADTLFVPLIGAVQDGHKYIPDALERGSSVVFVCESAYRDCPEVYGRLLGSYPSAVFILVADTLKALQKLAAAYIKCFPDLIRIGVTGSSGKTTTKELIASVLSEKYAVVMSQGNLNSETGLPLSVFSIRRGHQVGIFEMGSNKKGEIRALADILFPVYGVVTNIGTAHIGIFGTKDAIAEEKKQIFSHFTNSCTAVLPAADDYADFLQEGVCGRKILYGEGGVLPISQTVSEGLDGTSFNYENIRIRLPLAGEYNFLNALAAVALARDMGLTPAQIKQGIEKIQPLSGRSEILRGSVTVIQDCYNANPDSMSKALFFFSTLKSDGNKILVLGDMLELGECSAGSHSKILMQACGSDVSLIVLVGPEMSNALSLLPVHAEDKSRIIVSDSYERSAVEQTALQLKKRIKKGDIVLLKGSNGVNLKRFTPYLLGETAENA